MMTEEQKNKISKSLMGHEVSIETRIKISNKLKGREPNSGSFKKGMTPWNKGKKISDMGYVSPHKGITGSKSTSWKGGKRMYYQNIARRMCKDAGFDIENKVVHHKNGDFTDNRLENFQILTRSEHLKLHNPLQFRKEYKAWNKGKKLSKEHIEKLKQAWIKRKNTG